MYQFTPSETPVAAVPMAVTEVCPTQFEQLIEEHNGLFKRVAATYEVNTAKQQELFQEICLAVWLALPSFKGNSSLKTYMLRIAHNRSVNHVAKEVKEGSFIDGNNDAIELDSSDGPDMGQELEQTQRARQLMYHVRQLPLQQRQVFALLMEGLSYQDIAQINGISVQHTGVMIMRIKKKLSEAMAHE